MRSTRFNGLERLDPLCQQGFRRIFPGLRALTGKPHLMPQACALTAGGRSACIAAAGISAHDELDSQGFLK